MDASLVKNSLSVSVFFASFCFSSCVLGGRTFDFRLNACRSRRSSWYVGEQRTSGRVRCVCTVFHAYSPCSRFTRWPLLLTSEFFACISILISQFFCSCFRGAFNQIGRLDISVKKEKENDEKCWFWNCELCKTCQTCQMCQYWQICRFWITSAQSFTKFHQTWQSLVFSEYIFQHVAPEKETMKNNGVFWQNSVDVLSKR